MRRSAGGPRAQQEQAKRTEYIAIQNILASTAFAGWSGCSGEQGITCQTCGRDLTEEGSQTHAAALEHPERRAVVIHLVPEPQTDEHSPGDVPDRPEVEREQHDDENRLIVGLRRQPSLARAPSRRHDNFARTEKT